MRFPKFKVQSSKLDVQRSILLPVLLATTLPSAFAAQPAAAPPRPVSSVASGWFDAPFTMALSVAMTNATIRYTLDGSKPTATTGILYRDPLRITNVAVLRAATFAPNSPPSPATNLTFLFLEGVVNQSAHPAGFPNSWGPDPSFPGNQVIADYEMDSDPLRVNPNNPRSAIDPAKAQRLRDGLRELPVLSLVLHTADMFGANGLYTRSMQKQPPLEKECSVEMILPNGAPGFSVTGALRVHGNASRQPNKSPKHGFKLTFKKEFGEANLRYRLFEDSTADKFDDLVLRPDFGVSWLHWSDAADESFGAFQRTRAVRFRDAWLKETFRAMGHVASHNRFVHLFLNGLYWGIYDITEQPTDSFAERTFGGAKEDYDVFDQGMLASGSPDAYAALLAIPRLELATNYAKIQELLDLPEFIDYMLVHFFAGHQDWGLNKNWYAIRQRTNGSLFRYYLWDGENILMDETINRVAGWGGAGNVPSGLHTKLLENAEYRLAFADHVQRHMIAPGGALTKDSNITRWKKWQALLDKPIVAESARWGDYRRDVHPFMTGTYQLYTRESHWLPENNRIVNSYFVHRGDIVLDQLRAVGLYPSIDAPVFSRQGARGESGVNLTITAPRGMIYYTVNGEDPRVPGTGAVSPRAVQYRGTTVPVQNNANNATVKARVLNGRTWSALTETRN